MHWKHKLNNKKCYQIYIGISQLSTVSCTGVSCCPETYHNLEEKSQFKLGASKSPVGIIENHLESGYIPSYCTTYYSGDRISLQ